MAINSYRDLIVWQKAMRLTEQIYRASSCFPRSELFGLRAQIQRCAVSIPSNIAEGHARESTREYLRFLSIATGSAAELQTQIDLANRLMYIDAALKESLLEQAGEVMKMLHGLRNSLRKKLRTDFPEAMERLFPNP
jgi:four helix bundle protein